MSQRSGRRVDDRGGDAFTERWSGSRLRHERLIRRL